MENVAIIVCYCLHYVVLYSQNVELYEACRDGNVRRVKEKIAGGADINYHNHHYVSIVIIDYMYCTCELAPPYIVVTPDKEEHGSQQTS